MNEIENRLLKRFTVLKKIDYYIKESVYYRSFSEDLGSTFKKHLWTYGQDSGKISVYEDSI